MWKFDEFNRNKRYKNTVRLTYCRNSWDFFFLQNVKCVGANLIGNSCNGWNSMNRYSIWVQSNFGCLINCCCKGAGVDGEKKVIKNNELFSVVESKSKIFKTCIAINNFVATLMHHENKTHVPSIVAGNDCLYVFFSSFSHKFVHDVMYNCNSV